MSRTSRLRRNDWSLRFWLSLKTLTQSIPLAIALIWPASLPMAYMLPTTAPMLVPEMTSTGIWRRSSSSMTPIWAKPLAPPPLSTSPIRGRLLAVKAGKTAVWAIALQGSVSTSQTAIKAGDIVVNLAMFLYYSYHGGAIVQF